eukprot:scaffold24879_cov46-Cyclotella_meneghiniana.AAC.2
MTSTARSGKPGECRHADMPTKSTGLGVGKRRKGGCCEDAKILALKIYLFYVNLADMMHWSLPNSRPKNLG